MEEPRRPLPTPWRHKKNYKCFIVGPLQKITQHEFIISIHSIPLTLNSSFPSPCSEVNGYFVGAGSHTKS